MAPKITVKSNEGLQLDPFRTITKVHWAEAGWLVISFAVIRESTEESFDLTAGTFTAADWEFNAEPKLMPFDESLPLNKKPDGLEANDFVLRGNVHSPSEVSSEITSLAFVRRKGKTQSVELTFPSLQDLGSDSDSGGTAHVGYFMWPTSIGYPEGGGYVPIHPPPTNLDEALGPYPFDDEAIIGPQSSWLGMAMDQWANGTIPNFASEGMSPPAAPDHGNHWSTHAGAQAACDRFLEFYEAAHVEGGNSYPIYSVFSIEFIDDAASESSFIATRYLQAFIIARLYKTQQNFPFNAANELLFPNPETTATALITQEDTTPERVVTIAVDAENNLTIT